MNSAFETKQNSAGKIPPWLKWLLLILLFVSTVTGFFFSTRMIPRPAAKDIAVINKPAALPKTGEFGGFTVFRDKTGSTKIEIICHGMGVGKDGVALAVIDGQIVKPGAVIRGMKIIEISVGSILVEYNGKRLRLSPGESLTPKKQ